MSNHPENANLVRTSIAQFSSQLQRSAAASTTTKTASKKIVHSSSSSSTIKKKSIERQQDDDEVCLGDDSEDENEHEANKNQNVNNQETESEDDGDESESEDDDNNSFQLPILPKGKILVCRILSSWSSSTVVGLSGIELFDENGDAILGIPSSNIVPIHHQNQKSSSSSSLFPLANILKEPFDTTDTTKMWADTFPPSSSTTKHQGFAIVLNHHQKLSTTPTTTLSAIRIWNFNCTDRAHLSWGVREMEIFLDETKIFSGEIRQSAGDAKNETGVETLLFTEDVEILSRIAEQAEERSSRWEEAVAVAEEKEDQQPLLSVESPKQNRDKNSSPSSSSIVTLSHQTSIPNSASSPREGIDYFSVKNNLEIIIADNWNEDASSKCIALTGIQFLDERGKVIDFSNDSFFCEITEGWSKRPKVSLSCNIQNLFDDNPRTSFIVENISEFPIILTFQNFPVSKISALKIANFTGGTNSSTTTFLGIKHFRIRVDGKEILDGFNSQNCKSVHAWLIARKAPCGSHQLEKNLYQTFRASSIYWGGNSNNNSSSSSSSSALLSASLTALAKVAILRSKYLSSSNSCWPSWIVNSSSSSNQVDTNVPFLPTGYVFSITAKILNKNSSSSVVLALNNLQCYDEDAELVSLDNVSSIQSHQNTTSSSSLITFAFEDITSLSIISFELENHNGENDDDREVDVSIFCDDEIIYGNVFSLPSKTKKRVVVIPFVPDEKILSRFKQYLC